MEHYYELKIPKSRVAVLIGKSGADKRRIEALTNTRMSVDSKEGDVFLSSTDPLGLYAAREIVTAVGRGFSPEAAMQLGKMECVMEVIDIGSRAKSKSHLMRIRGRLIGSQGKTRQLIEELTETSVSVFGKTVAVLGEAEGVAAARKALEMLIGGSLHSTVYRWLEANCKEMKRKRMAL